MGFSLIPKNDAYFEDFDAAIGIVREITLADDGNCEIMITPTYSGCPAMDAIAFDIKMKLICREQ